MTKIIPALLVWFALTGAAQAQIFADQQPAYCFGHLTTSMVEGDYTFRTWVFEAIGTQTPVTGLRSIQIER